MAGVWKRDGTVAVTNGSKKVTGTGTTFADAKNGVAKGHLFCMTTGTTVDLYEVDYVVSNTELHLVQAFRGTTGTGKAYEIITTFSDSIPEFARKLNASLSYYQSQSDMVQQLFTSDAAEITVTAPDGTTHKLIPWKRVTSEGEGQAARAKVEADRSKTEADRSGTEADRAAGIVALAALPMPDVWAPLTDSLRLFTGYGREVKVGEDVVARMVNFSRSTTATYIDKSGVLRTAAINEPRFEKEGLLIEGQSTNLNPRSHQFNWQDGYGASPAVQSPNTDQQTSSLITTIDVTAGRRRPFIAGILTVGKTYTISFRAKSDGGVISQVASQLTGAVYPAVAPGEWKTYSFTGVATGSAVDFQITGTSVSIAWIQVEELPLASSYIPTSGAAVTRAADTPRIPQETNAPSTISGFSFSAEVDFKADANRIFDAGDSIVFVITPAGFSGRWNNIAIVAVGSPATSVKHTVAASVNSVNKKVISRLNNQLISKIGIIEGAVNYTQLTIGNRTIPSDRALFGHVRNLKMWHIALSEEQIKAIA